MAQEGLAEVATNPELGDVIVTHAYRGVRVQLMLRSVLVIFAALTIGFFPPSHDLLACWLIVAAYAIVAAASAGWARRGGIGPVRWMWLLLLADVAALTALALVAGLTSQQSWTADVLVNGFFALPLLAATQLRTWICAVVVVPATAAYLAVSIATQSANSEPWASILLRTLVLAGLSVGCVALSRVQQSRVLTIAGLVRDRTGLLSDLVGIEARERAALAEQLHDGALQYLLAARQDLEDARDQGDPAAFDRVEKALAESSQLLRSTVSELHPAVLARVGLAQAVADLARAIGQRGPLVVDSDLAGWPDRPTAADALLYSAARELLTNVAKHAHASWVRLALRLDEQTARLAVIDDGRGIPEGALDDQLARGHIGLASQRARIVAAGGELTVSAVEPAGTRIDVELPVDTAAQSPAPVRR